MTTGLLITTLGQAAIAADLAGGADLVLTHVAFGDASGAPYNPNEAQTALVNERYRSTIASVAVVDGAIVVDAVIPADTPDGSARPSHGFNVAECGLFSAGGTLIGVARMGNGYKPPPSTGQASIATFRIKLAVANPSAITVVIDPVAQVNVGRNVRPFFLVIDGILNAPPGAPATGATYVVGAAPTGAWAGQAHKLAQWVGVWALSAVPTGHLVIDKSLAVSHASRWLERDGGGWVSASGSETRFGPVQLATVAEHTPGLLDTKAAHPKGVKAMIDAAIAALVNGAGAALDTLKELGDALAGYVRLQPLARAAQTIEGTLTVEPTTNTATALIARTLGGASNVFEGYVGATKVLTATPTGIFEMQGSTPAFQMVNSTVIWKNSCDANNWTLSRNGNRVFTFGQAVGLSSAYTAQLDCSSNGLAVAVPNANSLFAFLSFQHSSGGILGTVTGNPAVGTVAYNTTSDERLKDLAGSADHEPGLIKRLKIIWFRWKAMPDASPQRGALAQEVYLIWPEAVTVGRGAPGDGDFIAWSIDWSKLVPLLILEAQETDRRLDAIEDFVATSRSEAAIPIRDKVRERAAPAAVGEEEKQARIAAAMAETNWASAPPAEEALSDSDVQGNGPGADEEGEEGAP
jgi:hypothetical protein